MVASAVFQDGIMGHSAEFDNVKRAAGMDGVESGMTPAQHAGGANMSIDLASGYFWLAQVRYTYAGGTQAINAAHATLNRYDIVYFQSDGIHYTAGTPAAGTEIDPVLMPNLPASSVLVAAVYVAAADTAISDSEIRDERVILPNWAYPNCSTRLRYFGGYSLDGALSGAATISIVKHYSSITLASHNLTLNPTGMIAMIYCAGNCTLSGTSTISFTPATVSPGDYDGNAGTNAVGGNPGGGGGGVWGDGGTSGGSPGAAGGKGAYYKMTTTKILFNYWRDFMTASRGGNGGAEGGSAGGFGGGYLWLEIGGDLTLSNTASISVNGQNGGYQCSGGGGGGMVVILVKGKITTVAGTAITANGGNGGTTKGNGGGGGGGVVVLIGRELAAAGTVTASGGSVNGVAGMVIQKVWTGG